MSKPLVRNDDSDTDSEDSDNNTSEGSMPKLLIRKEHADEKHFKKELKWGNVSDTDD